MPHSDLPIITPDPAPRKSQAEKYGAVYYLGIAGLLVCLALVGYFALGAWTLRSVWSNIYILHDEHRSDADRIRAAYALARDPDTTPRERFDIALRKPLPPLARYLVAESLTPAVVDDADDYAAIVARSPGWPGWLRLLLLRPLAYRAGGGVESPSGPLGELAVHDDPMIRLWALYTLAASGDAPAAARLRGAADGDAREAGLARLLAEALAADGEARREALDAATRRLRRHHPESARLWGGWSERDGRLVREAAPELRAQADGQGPAPPGPEAVKGPVEERER